MSKSCYQKLTAAALLCTSLAMSGSSYASSDYKTLVDAVNDNTNTDKTYTLATDENVIGGNLDKYLEDSKLTIFGNNNGVNGTDSSAIVVLSDSTLEIRNVGSLNADGSVKSSWNGFLASSTPNTGGALRNHGDLNIFNSVFSQNVSANRQSAGVLYNTGTALIESSFFINNTGVRGSAIHNIGGNGKTGILTVNNSKFLGNTINQGKDGSGDGGAIFNTGTMTVTNSLFENNNAKGNTSNGGAIFNQDGTMNIGNSEFINNSTSIDGGAIDAYSGESIIDKSLFKGNFAGRNGGAVSKTADKLTVTNSKFEDNGYKIEEEVESLTEKGGAIYVQGSDTNISDSQFSGNKVSKNGGAIHLGEKAQLDNVVLTNNVAGQKGGAIYNTGSSDYSPVTLNKISVSENKAADGGAIYTQSGLTVINDSLIENNKAENSGGGVYSGYYAKLHADNVKFKNNTANAEGGAIYIESGSAGAEILNSSFEGNHAQTGGAILNAEGDTKISNSEFKGNTAEINGGAIADNANSILEKTVLTENSAQENGGAIYSNGMTTINDSQFTNNTAQKGGAVYVSEYATSSIDKSHFEGNKASLDGGAVYIGMEPGDFGENNFGTLTIKNSTFKNNSAQGKGGAIYNSGILNIIADGANTEFSGNTANGESNALYLTSGSTTNMNSYNGGNIKFNDKIEGEGTDSTKIFINHTEDDGSITPPDPDEGGGEDPFSLRVSDDAFGGDDEFGDGGGDDGFGDGETGGSGDKPLSNGNVIFNNTVKNASIYVENGTLILGEYNNNNLLAGDGYFENVDLNLKGGNLSSMNGQIDSIDINNWDSSKESKLSFDADLASEKSDTFNIKGDFTYSDSAAFTIGAVNILSDTTKNSLNLGFFTGVSDTFNIDGTTTYTAGRKYIFSSNNDGSLTVSGEDISNGFNMAAADSTSPSRAFSSLGDTNATADVEYIGGNDFTVFGNQHNLNGQNFKGIATADGQTLTINNIGTMNPDGTIKSSFNGFISENGGAIKNEGTLNVNDSIFSENTASTAGGAIHNTGTANIIDTSFINNKVDTASTIATLDAGNIPTGGAIYNNKSLTINAQNKDVVFKGNTVDGVANDIFNDGPDAVITFTGAYATDIKGGIAGSGTLNKSGNGILKLGGDNSQFNGDFNIKEGTVQLSEGGKYFNAANTSFEDKTNLSLVNKQLDNINLGNLSLNGDSGLSLDVDIDQNKSDFITSNSVAGTGSMTINNIVLLGDPTAKEANVNAVDTANNLSQQVNLGDAASTAYGKIYQYGVKYDKNTGMLNFLAGGGTGGGDNASSAFNPAILATPIAAQVGSYLTQLNSYENAFANMDMTMILTRNQRDAMKMRNKYAAADSSLTFSPTLIPEEERGAWFRPFSAFENVKLSGGPKVNNVMYGSLFGIDSELKELGKGFEGILTAYAGYNGSHQTYQGNSIYQNGGLGGLTGIVYKGNFFSGLTANVGANQGEASTMFGRDGFTMLTAGVASKTGYNWELLAGKVIIQPSYMMSYTFVNTFDYNNAAGVHITSDPLNAIQIAPGIKIIGNLKNGWQPYIGVTMVWNIMDKTKFQANDVSLPELSIDPYVVYGVGAQRRWGERFTGFGQTMIRSGGRNGVGFQLGLRFTI